MLCWILEYAYTRKLVLLFSYHYIALSATIEKQCRPLQIIQHLKFHFLCFSFFIYQMVSFKGNGDMLFPVVSTASRCDRTLHQICRV